MRNEWDRKKNNIYGHFTEEQSAVFALLLMFLGRISVRYDCGDISGASLCSLHFTFAFDFIDRISRRNKRYGFAMCLYAQTHTHTHSTSAPNSSPTSENTKIDKRWNVKRKHDQ